jgi:myo-inositol-1(or 4)-monophosphatase
MASMTTQATVQADWLGACRRAAEALHDILIERPTTAERVVETGVRGEGGDQTLLIDADAESAVFAELEKLHSEGARFTAVSEERGRVSYGSEETIVVIDPVDGSVNAKRGLPHHAISLAVADGPTMADVVFGYVHDFGPEEEWFNIARANAATTFPSNCLPLFCRRSRTTSSNERRRR